MKEITRRQFCSLNYCTVDKMYFVLNDQNFVTKFYANDDEEAVENFEKTDWNKFIQSQKLIEELRECQTLYKEFSKKHRAAWRTLRNRLSDEDLSVVNQLTDSKSKMIALDDHMDEIMDMLGAYED